MADQDVMRGSDGIIERFKDWTGWFSTISGGQIMLDGQAVMLDFVPGLQSIATGGITSNPQIIAFFEMSDEQMADYAVRQFGYTAQQAAAWVLVRNVLRDMARALGLAKR